MVARLAMLFGGRAAEELTFGEEKVTTGAGNDIEKATEMARRMVTQFGMSEAVGMMAVGSGDQEVFLGREINQRQSVSERTAELVDSEVKRLLDEAYQVALATLREHGDLLEKVAQALLSRETLDRDDVQLLASGEPLPDEESEPASAAAAMSPNSDVREPRRKSLPGSADGDVVPAPAMERAPPELAPRPNPRPSYQDTDLDPQRG